MTESGYVIWSIEHTAWWKQDGRGYSETLKDAGVYAKADAERIVQQANIVACHECMIPITALFGTVAITGETS